MGTEKTIGCRACAGGRGTLRAALLVTFVLLTSGLLAQSLSLTTLGNLPGLVNESSGIQATSEGIWTHNDSGGDPELYLLDSNANLLRTLVVDGATNIDWEELASDGVGNFYIGDFGNNANNRTDLVIYKIPPPATIPGDTVTAQAIYYNYPDQTAFPPPVSQQNFDMEAMVHAAGRLWLFSKNRTDPFNGYTRLYRLPDQPGTWTAQLVDSFYTGSGPAINDWVTGADVSPDRSAFVLLGYDKLWLFRCYGSNPLGGQVHELTLPFSQKEGVSFRNDHELVISDEALPPFLTARLYLADLSPWLNMECCPALTGLAVLPGATGTAQLTWKALDPAIGYRVALRRDVTGTFQQLTTTDTSLTVPGLFPGEAYTAAVRAGCPGELSPWSSLVGFSAPTLRATFDGSITQVQPTAALGPNPFTEKLTLRSTQEGRFRVRLFDASGEVILSRILRQGAVVPTMDLPVGIYLYALEALDAGDIPTEKGRLVKY
jgi:hypothetical protein